MTIKEIYIKDLVDFVHSDLYKGFKTVPISIPRALSQAKNPRALPDDLALMIALDNNNQLLGFVGALPEWILGNPVEKIYWNSCWWADPERGKSIAVPLLYQFFKKLDFNIFFNDLPTTSVKIIEKTDKFNILPPIEGARFFYQITKAHSLAPKNNTLKLFKPFLIISEKIINRFARLYLKSRGTKSEEFIQFKKVDSYKNLRPIFEKFDNSFFKRTEEEFAWIIQNPWLMLTEENSAQIYPFSLKVKMFRNELYFIENDKENIGFIWLTIRDGVVKIPYLCCNKQHLSSVADFVQTFIYTYKCTELITYHKELNVYVKHFLFKKKIVRHAAYPLKYEHHFTKLFEWHAGEGDSVFT